MALESDVCAGGVSIPRRQWHISAAVWAEEDRFGWRWLIQHLANVWYELAAKHREETDKGDHVHVDGNEVDLRSSTIVVLLSSGVY